MARVYGELADLEASIAPAYDFRRPDRFGREHVRGLEVAHEVFARRFASGLGGALRALVQFEPVTVDQLSFDDYVRSLPNPTVAALVGLPPLPGLVTLDLDVRLALLLVDRLLGGGLPQLPDPAAARRPTELETFLLGDLLRHGVVALAETLAPLAEVTPDLTAIEYNPQLVQVAPPSDTVLVLTYRMTVSQGLAAEGLVSLCYPSATLLPLLDRMRAQQQPDTAAPGHDEAARALVRHQLGNVEVDASARLRHSRVSAADLAALRVGDVLRLEHRVAEPVLVEVGGVPVLAGFLGRRGRRLAMQVDRWLPTPGAGEPQRAADADHLPASFPVPASNPTSNS